MMRARALFLFVCFGCAVEVEPSTATTSLAGTEVDGRLRTDDRGTFLFDEEARLSFDYFLTLSGEVGDDQLDAIVRNAIAERLTGAARAEALDAWRAYVAYRAEAARALEEGSEDVEARILSALDRHLGRHPIATSERDRIVRAFANLRTDDPASFDATPAGRFLASRRAIALARSLGASTSELHAMRTHHFGADAAERLRALDERRAAWDERVARFRAARQKLTSPEEIARLERASFTESELRRVRALDRILAGGAR